MKFEAVIKLNNTSDKVVLSERKVKYPGCKTSEGDSISIKANEIKITGERTSNKLSNAYEVTHSTLFDHFINTLLFLYFTEKKSYFITSIKVNNLIFKKKQITQLFSNEIVFDYEIDETCLLLVLDSKYKVLRNTLLYYLQAFTANDSKRKFERLWMSFNSLYSYGREKLSEAEKLQYVKNQCIAQNKKLFTKTLLITNSQTDSALLNKMRWGNFLSNKLKFSLDENKKIKGDKKKTENKIYEEFYETLYNAYTDSRIVKCLYERILEKSFYIKKSNISSEKIKMVDDKTIEKINNKLKNRISNRTENSVNCIQLVGIDYAYFLRCTFFHGAVNDSYYELLQIDAFDDELSIVNPILSALIIELINSKLFIQ